jgi:hypothetical protein
VTHRIDRPRQLAASAWSLGTQKLQSSCRAPIYKLQASYSQFATPAGRPPARLTDYRAISVVTDKNSQAFMEHDRHLPSTDASTLGNPLSIWTGNVWHCSQTRVRDANSRPKHRKVISVSITIIINNLK